MPEAEARLQPRAGAGGQLDPDAVNAFLRVLDRRESAYLATA